MSTRAECQAKDRANETDCAVVGDQTRELGNKLAPSLKTVSRRLGTQVTGGGIGKKTQLLA